MGETTGHGNTRRPLGEIDRSEQRLRFFRYQHQVTDIKNFNVNQRQDNSRQNVEKKYLVVPKVVGQTQQNTNDRKNKKNTIPEALISNRVKEVEKEPIRKTTYTRKYGTIPEEKVKERNCRYCSATNWNPNHKCPDRESIWHNSKKKENFEKPCLLEHRKQEETIHITEPEETEESDTEKSMNIITEIEHVIDGRNHFIMTKSSDGTEKEFIVDNDSLNEELIENQKMLPITTKHQDVHINQVKFARWFPIERESRGIRKYLTFLITEKGDLKTLLGMDWLREVNWMIQDIESSTETTDQPERNGIFNFFLKNYSKRNERLKRSIIKQN